MNFRLFIASLQRFDSFIQKIYWFIVRQPLPKYYRGLGLHQRGVIIGVDPFHITFDAFFSNSNPNTAYTPRIRDTIANTVPLQVSSAYPRVHQITPDLDQNHLNAYLREIDFRMHASSPITHVIKGQCQKDTIYMHLVQLLML